MSAEKHNQSFFRWWHWLFTVAIVLFWIKGPGWAKSGEHFGYGLWPLLLVMFLTFLSPVFAIADLFITQTYYEDKLITKFVFWIRRIWSVLLLLNIVIFLWGVWAFDNLLS